VRLIVDPPQRARERVPGLVGRGLERGILELLETVLVYKFAELTREEIEAMFGLSELKQTRVYQEAQQEGEANLTLRLLRRKLNIEIIPQPLESMIRDLPVERIEALGEALLDFSSFSDLERWLEQGSADPQNN
jgi:predicted transposase YdaD